MSEQDLEMLVYVLGAATLVLVWVASLPVSDPLANHDWEAEASDYAAGIRPGDHWGR